MKLVAILIVLVALGLAAYFVLGKRILAPPEVRACARLGQLCAKAENVAKPCSEALGKLRDTAGKEALERTASCLEKSDSCTTAAGCLVGGIGGGIMGGFLQGLKQSLGH